MKHFKSKGTSLALGGDGKEICVIAQGPKNQGRYSLKVSVFSEDVGSLSKVFSVHVMPSVIDGNSRGSSLLVLPEA